jgi:general secretion pathway protein A
LILNPAFSGAQLLRAILQDFGLPPNGSTRGELFQTITQFLLRQAAVGSIGVLIIDEAQALSSPALEQVRLLSNVETTKVKLLQIVLVGQPELAHRLKTDPRLRALHQRISVRYHIQPLSAEEVAAYVAHRLRTAGSKGGPLFTPEAIHRIARLSQGVPRQINQWCDRVLLAGFVQGTKTLDETLVEKTLGGFS